MCLCVSSCNVYIRMCEYMSVCVLVRTYICVYVYVYVEFPIALCSFMHCDVEQCSIGLVVVVVRDSKCVLFLQVH